MTLSMNAEIAAQPAPRADILSYHQVYDDPETDVYLRVGFGPLVRLTPAEAHELGHFLLGGHKAVDAWKAAEAAA